MGSKRERKLVLLVIVFAAAILVAVFCSVALPRAVGRGSDQTVFQNVDDLELLSPEQKQEARETGYAAFDFGGMHYVVEGMPHEYYMEE